jgi:CubicO group peptidase (beta-lactamase class C family)
MGAGGGASSTVQRALRWLAAGASLALLAACATPQARLESQALKLDRALAPLVDAPGRAEAPGLPPVAGLAVAIVRPDGSVLQRAYGRAVIDPAFPKLERPLTVNNPMRIASLSKLLVGLAAMRLVETGQLDLSKDAGAYLGWVVRNPNFPTRVITVGMIASHTSSVRDVDLPVIPLPYDMRHGFLAGGDMSAGGEHWAKDQPPGYFKYANLNTGLLATILEAATGERFDALMKRLVFEPLKLSACFNWIGCSDAQVAEAVTLYRRGVDEAQWAPWGPWMSQVDDLKGKRPTCPALRATPDIACDLKMLAPGANASIYSPQGGLRMSLADLARVAQLLAGDGALEGVRFLKPETLSLLSAPMWRSDGLGANGDTYEGAMCGYGLHVQTLTGGAAGACRDDPLPLGRSGKSQTMGWIGHLGEAYGLLGGLWVDPKSRTGYVYLITGTPDDPTKHPGQRSAFTAWEEAVLQALRAVRPPKK